MKSILFTPGNVKAIYDGLKWQTRREIKPQPIAHDHKDFVEADWKDEPPRYVNSPNTPLEFWCALCGHGVGPTGKSMFKSKYQVGDILYVKEAFAIHEGSVQGSYAYSPGEEVKYPPHYLDKQGIKRCIYFKADYPKSGLKWRSPLFMPQCAARLFLKITNVRVEKLQDISEQDAIAEGIKSDPDYHGSYYDYAGEFGYALTPNQSYQTLWESIHGPGSWSPELWVFVYDFVRVEKPQ